MVLRAAAGNDGEGRVEALAPAGDEHQQNITQNGDVPSIEGARAD